MNLYVLLWTKLSIQVIGLAVNIIGFYVVYVFKTSSNQCLILMNLSITEVGVTLNGMVRDIWTIVLSQETPLNHNQTVVFLSSTLTSTMTQGLFVHFPVIYDKIFNGIYYLVVTELVLTMTVLTVDRLMCILSPLKYKTYMTNKNMSRIILSSYVLSFIAGLLCVLLPQIEFAMSLLLVANAVAFLFIATITYYITVQRIKDSKRMFTQKRLMHTRELVLFKKHYIVPAMIVFTFIVFYVIPWFVQLLYDRLNPNTVENLYVTKIVSTFQNIGAISDPCIYVFLTQYYRNIISAKLFMFRYVKRMKGRRRGVSRLWKKQKIYEVRKKMKNMIHKEGKQIT